MRPNRVQSSRSERTAVMLEWLAKCACSLSAPFKRYGAQSERPKGVRKNSHGGVSHTLQARARARFEAVAQPNRDVKSARNLEAIFKHYSGTKNCINLTVCVVPEALGVPVTCVEIFATLARDSRLSLNATVQLMRAHVRRRRDSAHSKTRPSAGWRDCRMPMIQLRRANGSSRLRSPKPSVVSTRFSQSGWKERSSGMQMTSLVHGSDKSSRNRGAMNENKREPLVTELTDQMREEFLRSLGWDPEKDPRNAEAIRAEWPDPDILMAVQMGMA